MGPAYNPVVKNGLFEVTVPGHVAVRCRSIDSDHAKYVVVRRVLGNDGLYTPLHLAATVKVIEPTRRKYD